MSIKLILHGASLLAVWAAVGLTSGCSTQRSAEAPERVRVALIAEGCTTNGFVVSRRTVTDAVAEAGFVPLVLPNLTCTNRIDALLDKADALVIFGSLGGTSPVRNAFEKRLILRAAARNVPVVGFCHGHQVINCAFGGTIKRNPANAAVKVVHHGKTNPYVQDTFHKVRVKPGTLTADALGAGEQTVNTSHNWSVDRLAEGFDVTAVAEDGVVEAIEHRTLPVVGFQFHPERLVYYGRDPKFVKLIKAALENRR